jgi:hypothetical protein
MRKTKSRNSVEELMGPAQRGVMDDLLQKITAGKLKRVE